MPKNNSIVSEAFTSHNGKKLSAMSGSAFSLNNSNNIKADGTIYGKRWQWKDCFCVCVGGGCFGREGQSSPVQTNHNPKTLVYTVLTYLLLVLHFLWLWVWFFPYMGGDYLWRFSPQNSSIELINWLALPKCAANIYLLKAYPRKQFSYRAQMRNFWEWQNNPTQKHTQEYWKHMSYARVQVWTFLNQF